LLLAVLGLALLILGAIGWWIVQPQQSVADFGPRLYELASKRGADLDDVSADRPIRKIDGVFVRSWQIAVPDRNEMEALIGDLVREVESWNGFITEPPVIRGETASLRIDFDNEAFDVQLVVSEPAQVVEMSPTAVPTASPVPTKTPKRVPSPGARGRLAIMLDDAGQNTDLLAVAVGLDRRVAVAVLPFLPDSSRVAAEMHRAGHEVWLHLPMEPQGYPENDPGPGTVFVEMSDDEIRTTVHAALNNVPHVIGVNNHMGSRATADLRTMTWVMQELKAREMAFIDSRTTRHTVAEDAARAQGVKTNRRHVFLDNERSPKAIRRQLAEAITRCRLDGEAIAIGHFDSVTVGVLQEELPLLADRGADLVPPSALVR
jgi:polysaccharide deacetylase 2 family uncharacterized protein YibQ